MVKTMKMHLKKLLKEPNSSYPNLPPYYIHNDCSNCQFYRDTITSGKPYIGDSPCDWCQKRQATCNSTSVADQYRSGVITATNKMEGII